ncbi:uncharacterized protein BROUX77_002577 [Berkeleyomyces rouxiae]
MPQQTEVNPQPDVTTFQLLQSVHQLLSSQQCSPSPTHNISWPQWDGQPSSFKRFFNQLKLRARISHRHRLTPSEICFEIFMSIPQSQQPRLDLWLDQGEAHDWDWEKLLEHINDQFTDKQAVMKAGQKLMTMRMGEAQTFNAFLQDYEYSLSACGGWHWPDRCKILFIDAALNDTLQYHLTPKKLPDDDYNKWVTKVRTIAGRVECLPQYEARYREGSSSTWYVQQPVDQEEFPIPEAAEESTDEEDTEDGPEVQVRKVQFQQKSEVAALISQLETAAKIIEKKSQQKFAEPPKPRAPWRAQSDIEKARLRQACFRCLEQGHRSFRCPKFRPAESPAEVHATTTPENHSIDKKVTRRESPTKDRHEPISPRKTKITDAPKQAISQMHSSPFLIEAFIDNSFYCDALFDSGCLVTSAFNESLVKKKGLQRMPITKRELRLAENDEKKRWISEIAFCELDIDGRKETVYGYVIPNLAYDMILGKPWMERNDVVYLAKERVIRLGSGADALMVREKGWLDAHVPGAKANMVMASVFAAEIRHSKKKKEEIQVFAATIHDINKALEVKRRMTLGEITEQLPEELKHLGHVFLDDEKRDLPPNRPGIDHAIKLTKDNNGKEKEVPWGPLYGMSRDELLVLRKTLSDHLDKNWIRASSSPGGAPVLFVRKPGGGLRFCVDYRGINAITEKDRYPLPLISETLRSLAKARYFTKVDVRAAFHKIRVKEGDEWKTAFRTRFGLYEWLVTPFGLTGAPATFQRYINSTLREHLDDFCSAYLDDVLIYTDGSRKEHMEKVELVLKKLGDAGLCLDLNKCEFAVTETKYLGFIIQAGQGVKVDPAKVAAIREWVPPTNVKGVRSFIGFANFYRQFIDSFSEVAAPLVSLTKKGVPWKWGQAEESAFETLKNLFITAPVLAMWDEDRTTVVECDCSGWALGGTLSQVDDDGKLRPVAFFSKKLSPAEVNYEIHDKELLAVVKCLEEWRGELKSLGAPFKILSDHKNLQYFMTTRKLSERQVRWSQMLSEFDFKLEFRSGSKSGKPDALSRRQQDVPQGEDDDRLKSRIMKLIKDQWIPHTATVPVAAGDIAESPDNVPDGSRLFVQPHLQELWDQAKDHDSDMQEMYQALAAGERSFPPSLTKKITISIAECEFDQRGALLYRHKLFVPEWEPLRTALIQKTHDSHITGHPGRDGTLAILSREFFWPGISRDVRRFCANCNVCGRSKVWRERKKGLLLPLPIPQRPHSELGIDFMTELPAKKSGDPRYLMVIVDRLTGGVALEAMNTMKAEQCAESFLQCYWKHHGFPRALVSDRGTNWTSEFWTHLCKLTGIEQRLSTGFHPQTDGATERMNQEVLTYLRSFITYSQYDWPDLLPSAMLAINNRNTSMGMSPFFLTHGYHVSPIEQVTAEESVPRRLEHRDAEKFIQRLHEGWELAQAAMAARQQDMEDQANRSRGPQVRFEVGDTVWLKLKNISTPQLSKKLSWTNAMYKVRKIVSPHVVELDVPTNVHPRFHVDLLKPASQNPFPSQETDDTQPPPIEENEYGEPEYLVERILRSRQRRVGRGYRREVLVKWAGYAEPDWRPRVDFEDTEALEMFEAEFGTEDDVGVPEADARTGPRTRTRGGG